MAKGEYMGLRFRKSINLGGGMRINFNKKSVGFSFGKKGMRYSVNSNGRKTATVGIPGTGLYYTDTSNAKSQKQSHNSNQNNSYPNNPNHIKTCKNCGNEIKATDTVCPHCGCKLKNMTLVTILLLYFFFPLGLYFMWAKTQWKKVIKIIITAFFAINALFFLMICFSATGDIPNEPKSTTNVSGIVAQTDNETTTEELTTESTTKESTTEKETTTKQTISNTTTTQKETTTQKQTTTKKVNSPNSNGKAVYRTPSGKRYHFDPDCGGKNSYEVSLDDAKAHGLTPCEKCAN